MSKRITVEELAEHIDEVKRGETLTLVEGETPVATVSPLPKTVTVIRHDPALRLQDFKPGPRPKKLDFDGVQWLIDDRERDRSGRK
jgi:antitoxin (DNA-binding transcriptional repressor) of toxin-antitoxin stability system